MSEKEFNLLDEKWILAMDDDGRVGGYSLCDIFAEAHGLKRLSGELPTQDFAVMRVLIAVLYAVYQKKDADGCIAEISDEDEAFERWEALWKRGCFDVPTIREYLEGYRDRFFLFHPTRPFYQAPIDRGTDYLAAKLNGEISESSNKPRLFSSLSGERKESMGFAEATRWLINLNAYDDTSAKPSVRGANLPSCGAGWIGKLGPVFIEGDNLFQTLLLNLVLVSEEGDPFPEGVPAWEPESAKTDERTPIPMPESPVEILTLQSRRLLLSRAEDSVTGFRLLGGDIVDKENAFIEQMTVWRQDKEGNFNPARHDPSRSVWRNYQSFLVKNLEERANHLPGVVRWIRDLEDRELIDYDSVRISIVGVQYADKDFFVENYTEDSLDINAGLLSSMNEGWNTRIAKAVSLTDEITSALWSYSRGLFEVCGCDDGYCKSMASNVKTRAYHDLDLPFRSWLRGIDPSVDDIDETMREWTEAAAGIVTEVAKEILKEAGERALVGKGDNSAFTQYRIFSGRLYKLVHGGCENE